MRTETHEFVHWPSFYDKCRVCGAHRSYAAHTKPETVKEEGEAVDAAKPSSFPPVQTGDGVSNVPSDANPMRLPWRVEEESEVDTDIVYRWYYIYDCDNEQVLGSHTREHMDYLCAAVNEREGLVARAAKAEAELRDMGHTSVQQDVLIGKLKAQVASLVAEREHFYGVALSAPESVEAVADGEKNEQG